MFSFRIRPDGPRDRLDAFTRRAWQWVAVIVVILILGGLADLAGLVPPR